MSQVATQAECHECDREFTVEFSGTSSLSHTTTRFCPRCGTRL